MVAPVDWAAELYLVRLYASFILVKWRGVSMGGVMGEVDEGNGWVTVTSASMFV